MSIGWDTVALAVVLLAAVVLAAWFGRDRRFRKVRFGVFVERERWPDESEDP